MKLLGSLLLFIAFCATALADQSVTLAWDPNPEPDVSSYLIHYGNESRNYQWITNVGNVTTATVYGLQEGKTYYFAVTATNTSGIGSDYSNEVTNAIPADLTNRVPTITALPDISILVNHPSQVIPFTIHDVETPPEQLVVTASSTNQALLPDGAIVLVGTNAHRAVSLMTAPNQSGQTLITLIVSDGAKASSESFVVTVLPVPVQPKQLVFRSTIQCSDSVDGPWTNLVTTILPVPMDGNLFYRTWGNAEVNK